MHPRFQNIVHTRTVYLITFGVIAGLLHASNSQAKCLESATYQITFTVTSCSPLPSPSSGTSLVIKLVTKSLTNTPPNSLIETREWLKDAKEESLTVFSDESRCPDTRKDAVLSATINKLCCDGGEPRCTSGIESQITHLASVN